MSREEQEKLVPFVDTREMRDRTFLGIVALAAILLAVLVLSAGTASGQTNPTITVDGVTYTSTKTSGPTIHFQTPDSNPTEAFTERNVWTGNGSEHLPCEGGIHWIDNQNVLTVSNCLPPEGTTTTTVGTTTPSSVATTTTVVDSSTTTTPEVSSTTVTETSSMTIKTTSPTTTPPAIGPSEPPTELPYTGPADLVVLAAAATALIATGVAAVRYRNDDDEEVVSW